VADVPNPQRSHERLLAFAGAAVFAALCALAVLLWLREGTVVYLARIIGDLQNCL
jgi:ferric-dicitrate binding protein FerR (iron transport regulator)